MSFAINLKCHLESRIQRFINKSLLYSSLYKMNDSDLEKFVKEKEASSDADSRATTVLDFVIENFEAGNEYILSSITSVLRENLPAINHYTKRAYELLVVPPAAIAMLPIAALCALGIKVTEGWKAPVFHRKKLKTYDGTEQYQLKFRSMKLGANDQYSEMVKLGVLNPGGKKKDYDPRVTRFGKVLRKTSLDELPQLYQLFFHILSPKGFFYNPTRHYHYLVSPRAQSEESISHASAEYREDLSKGRSGVTGPDQVNRKNPCYVSEGYYARLYNHWMDTKWILPTDIAIIAKTPLAMLRGHNS